MTISRRSIALPAMFIFGFHLALGQPVTREWIATVANGSPYGTMVALDQEGNILTTGYIFWGDIVTTKYDQNGTLLWQRPYTMAGYGLAATWITTDASGNVIVTGYPHTRSSNPVEVGLLTLKYDSDGNLLWSDLYSGTWAFAVRGITDSDGNIYVAGRGWFGTHDFITIKYAPDGTILWLDIFDQNGGFHTPTAMDLDGNGNLIITGTGLGGGGLITVLYDAGGTKQWVVERSGNSGSSVLFDGNGNFFLTGSLYTPSTSNDVMVQKYTTAGTLVWERFYDLGGSEFGRKLAFDQQGNIYVIGIRPQTAGLPYTDWVTMKLNPTGILLWSNQYNAHLNNDEYPVFLVTGPQNEVYVTGTGGPAPPGPIISNQSMVTIRYNADGTTAWTDTYYETSSRGVGAALGADNSLYVVGLGMITTIKYAQAPGGLPPVVSDIPNQTIAPGGKFKGIAADNYVTDPDHPDTDITWSWTGNSAIGLVWDAVKRGIRVKVRSGWTGSETVTFTATDPDGLSDSDPATFTVTSAVLDRTTAGGEVPSETVLEGNYPNPFNPTTTISYGLAAPSRVSLVVYNVLGQQVAVLVDGLQAEGYHEAVFDAEGLPSGVYIFRLNAGEYVRSGKMLLSK